MSSKKKRNERRNYNQLDKRTLVRLNKDFDEKNGSILSEFYNANTTLYVKHDPIPDFTINGKVINKTKYNKLWTKVRLNLIKNLRNKEFLKAYTGSRIFTITVPEEVEDYLYSDFRIRGIFNSLKLAFILLMETDKDFIYIKNNTGSAIAKLCKAEFDEVFLIIIKETKLGNIESELDNLLNDICGCADHISLVYDDNETAEKIDRSSYKLRRLFETLINK